MDAIKRIKFYFICCLVTLNGLFIGYALGLNSRHVLVVDPKLPKYVKPEVKHDAVSKADQAGEPVPAAAKDKNGMKGKGGTNSKNDAKDKGGAGSKGGAKEKGDGSRKSDAKDKSNAKDKSDVADKSDAKDKADSNGKSGHPKSDSRNSAKKVEAQSTSKNKDTSSKLPGAKQNSDHASP